MNLRQPERRLFFDHIFRQMPLWEVWTEDNPVQLWTDPPQVVTITRSNFRAVPRRLRRQMARLRARREWRAAAHGGGGQ